MERTSCAAILLLLRPTARQRGVIVLFALVKAERLAKQQGLMLLEN